MKHRITKELCICLFLFITGMTHAQVFPGTGGPISNDSLPNTFPVTVSMGFTSIDTNFGVYGVTINLLHPYDADLNIFLVSPSGVIVELSTKNGGSGDNYTNCTFTHNTNNKITSANPPFAGNYRPESSLSVVNNGQNPNGTWQLLIVDSKRSADAGSLLGWSLIFSSNPAKPVPFTSSNLPLIVINTYNQPIPDEPKINGRMYLINNDSVPNTLADTSKFYNHRIKIENHGSSSQSFPKKPYGFFTVDAAGADSNTTLLGLPSEHNWILNATYNDKSLMRDVMAYEFARRSGRYASRYRYCEVFLNGKYIGIYILMEKIKRDANRVDIAKLKLQDTTGNDLTGGYIVKIDKTTGNGSGGWTDTFPTYPGSPYRILYQYDYPEQADMMPQQSAYIKNYIYLFENALAGSQFTDPVNGYRKYADVNSFIDYSIMNEISKNVDGYRLSTYMYKDKDSKGGKLVLGPVWDFNLAFGNANYYNGQNPVGWEIDIPGNGDSYQNPFWWKRFRQDTAFLTAYYCRWNQLRTTVFTLAKINQFIDSTYGYLKEASFRNFQRWPVMGVYVWPNPTPLSYTFEDELYALKYWINLRFQWMDGQLSPLCTSTMACKPKVVLNAEKTSVYKNQKVKLFADGVGSSFLWYPSTGLSSTTGREVVATMDTNRTYFVLMQTSNGCYDTASVSISVNPLPAKSVTGNNLICPGQSTILTASAGAVSYRWSPAASLDTTGGQQVKASPGLTTTYKMVATNASGCSDSSYFTVTVVPTIHAGITASKDTVCKNSTAVLTASGASSYKWLPAEGLTDSTGNSVTVRPVSDSVVYTVVGSSLAGCVDTARFVLRTFPKHFLSIQSASTQVCIGSGITLTAIGGTGFTWLPANGFGGANGSIITVTPATNTTYRVAGMNAAGCLDTASVTITVSAIPVVKISTLDSLVCAGGQTVLVATGAGTYRWLPAPGLTDTTGMSVVVAPQVTTTYKVVGKIAAGCEDTGEFTVYVLPPVHVSVSGTSKVCKGESTRLIANGASKYQWSPASGLSETTNDTVVAKPDKTTRYRIIGTSHPGCADTVYFDVVVNDTPNLSFTPSLPVVKKGQQVSVTVSGAKTYQWFPATGLNISTGATVLASPLVTTTYEVTGTDSLGCSGRKSVTITVDNTGVITHVSEQPMIYPNPTRGEVHLKIHADAELKVYTVNGALACRRNVPAGETSFDAAELSPGMYLFIIQDAAEQYRFKVIRQ